ncbi:unnamed protein product, partial [Polarella glacialis]
MGVGSSGPGKWCARRLSNSKEELPFFGSGATSSGAMTAALPSRGSAVGFDQILGFARDNDAAAIREIVKMGCPPSFTNRVGQTPLHIAAIWGSVEAAQALLELGANPNAANQLRGSTPLHAAALGKGPPERRAECVRLMIQAKG